MDLFKLLGTIAVDNADANKALDETSQKGEQAKNKLSKGFTAMGKGAVAFGKVTVKTLAAGGVAMGALTVKALNLSGELEQNMGGSEAVFGKYADKMQSKAKEAYSNMGLSTSDYLATANKMGALFQGAGFSIEESMDLSSGAMQRAADVASIMGIDTSAAMEAIAGAAKGNFTMMDNLGVAMNDTTLQAYALEKGINKSTSEMTNQEKVALAMEMFMDKTAYAAGNYAKENETLAGSLGTAKAALTNFLDGSGDVDQLVDSFSNAASVIIENITTIAPRLISGVSEIINKVVPMLPGLLQQLLPVIIEGAVSLINGLVEAMPTIISAIMAALPALIDGILQITNALIQALPTMIQAVVSALPALIPQIVSGLVSMLVMLCTMIPQIIQPIIDYLPEIIISLVNALVENLPLLIEGAIQLIVGLVTALPEIILSLVEAMPTVITSLVEGLINAAPLLLDGMKEIWESVKESAVEIWEGLKGKVVEIAGKVKDEASKKFNELKEKASEKWEAMKTTASEKWESMKSKASSAWESMKSTASSKWESIKSKVTEKAEAIKSKASEKWESIKSKASGVWDSIKSTASEKWESIKSKITSPIETAKETISGIVEKIKGFFTGMKLEFPKIKMPHFGIKPKGWKIGDLLEGSIPKLSIDWYAKAMNNPMIMTRPTIFGYNGATGELLGGGEAGSEVVTGTSTLMRMIQSAVASENSAVVLYLQKLIEILADYFPQILEALDFDFGFDADLFVRRHAPKIDTELGKIQERKARGRA